MRCGKAKSEARALQPKQNKKKRDSKINKAFVRSFVCLCMPKRPSMQKVVRTYVHTSRGTPRDDPRPASPPLIQPISTKFCLHPRPHHPFTETRQHATRGQSRSKSLPGGAVAERAGARGVVPDVDEVVVHGVGEGEELFCFVWRWGLWNVWNDAMRDDGELLDVGCGATDI